MNSRNSERSTIWESSKRPMFIKSIWMDNEGYRHVILNQNEQQKHENRMLRMKPRRSVSQQLLTSSPAMSQSSFETFTTNDDESQKSLQLTGSCDIMVPQKQSDLNQKNDIKLCRKNVPKDKVMNELRKQLNCGGYGCNKKQFRSNKSTDDRKIDSELNEDKTDDLDLSTNKLTERVLQWLDLTGSNLFIKDDINENRKRPDTEALLKNFEKQSAKPISILRRSESVHHLSLTFDSPTSSSSEEFPNPTIHNRCQSAAIKFGDFFPTTYKCSKKFLSNSSLKKSASSLYTSSQQSINKLASENDEETNQLNSFYANENSIKRQTSISLKSPTTSTLKTKQSTINQTSVPPPPPARPLTRRDTLENQYKAIIHRHIYETTCNPQIVKRQLHIFIPKMPNRTKIVNANGSTVGGAANDCESCLSTIMSEI